MSALSFLGRVLLKNRHADPALSIALRPELAAPAESAPIALASRDFDHGEPMPFDTSRYGADQSPHLSWSGVPTGTAELLLIVEDIDVPFRVPLVHTASLLPASATEIDRGGLDAATTRSLIARFGRTGYHGPGPVPGHGPHRYGFHLYALSRPLPESVTAVSELLPAVAGTVLASGSLVGTYERP